MTTTNINTGVNSFIAQQLNTRKDKSAWSKAVTAYALELVETLDNWDNQPENFSELREMMLNGASDWSVYSWGGLSLICNSDIAERCCTPSELKRVTLKTACVIWQTPGNIGWTFRPAPCIRLLTLFATSLTTTLTLNICKHESDRKTNHGKRQRDNRVQNQS